MRDRNTVYIIHSDHLLFFLFSFVDSLPPLLFAEYRSFVFSSQFCFHFTIAFFRLFKYSVFDVYMNVTLPLIIVVSVKFMRIAKTNLLFLLVIFLFSVVFFPGFYFSFALKLLAHGRITISVQN